MDEMNEQEMADKLGQALEDAMGEEGEGTPAVRTFREAGVLTNNSGIVVTLPDGQVFHVLVTKENR